MGVLLARVCSTQRAGPQVQPPRCLALDACACLRRVVPGLPDNQYQFTLGLSIAAGLILGFVTQLEPQGAQRGGGWPVQRLALGAAARCLPGAVVL